jgi:hypothetical protein
MTAAATTTPETTKPVGRRKAAKATKSGGNPAVREAAENAGIDTDATPDQAALDEAAKAGSDGEAAKAAVAAAEAGEDTTELPTVTAVETTPQVDEAPPDPKAAAALHEKTRPAAVPPPRLSKKEQAAEKAAVKAATAAQSPSTRRLGELGKKLPGAEHVKVEKRQANGSLAYVGNYRMADLSQSQDMETFIAQYIKPHYGAGEYQLTGIDAHGREIDGGTVQILEPIGNADPLPQREGGALADVVKTLIRDRSTQPTQVNPISQLKELLEVKKSIDGEDAEAKAAEGGTVAAMISAMGQQSSNQMNMMVTLLTTLLPLMMKKEEDPIMPLLLAKLLDDKGGGGQLPPPLPPANPMADVLPIVQALAAVMKPAEGGEGDLKGVLLQHILTTSQNERLGPAQMVELFNSMRGERGTDDFKKSLDNMGFMMNAIRELRNQTEPVSGGWQDVVGALASNRELASSIAGAIRVKTDATRARVGLPGGAAYPALPAGGDEEAALMRRAEAARRRRIEIAEATAAAEEAALAEEQALDPLQHRPRVRNVPKHEPVPLTTPAPAAAPAAAPPAGAGPSDVDGAIQRVRERTGGPPPPLPPDIGDHINAMVAAEDEGAAVEAVINMLFYLSKLEHWSEFANTVLELTHRGDRVRATAFLGSFFNGMQEVGLADAALVQKVMGAVEANFEEITAHLQQHPTGEDEEDEEDEDEVPSLTDVPHEGFDTEEEDEEDDDPEGEEA